ncbi:MAG: adenylate kinase [Kiritimatiellia bacterium]|jgi:adenylate kinase
MDIIILLGAPGSGKGTAAERIAPRLNLRPVSSGALLRAAAAAGTAAGLEAKSYMESGTLVPDALVGRVICEQLAAGGAETRWLLDGFPRTVVQAQMLEDAAKAAGGRVLKAFLLEVPEDVIVKRLAGRRVCPACNATYHIEGLPPKTEGVCDHCGTGLVIRPDDNEATVRNRLSVYATSTAPLADWYEERGLLVRIDGMGGAAKVADRLVAALS